MRIDRHAWIRPRDMAEYIDRDGVLWADPAGSTVWTQIPLLASLDCEHGSTACLTCWDIWMCDWEIQETDPRKDGERVTAVQYPDVLVTLTEGANASALITTVASALQAVHSAEAAAAFTDSASSCESFHEALRVAGRTVYIRE